MFKQKEVQLVKLIKFSSFYDNKLFGISVSCSIDILVCPHELHSRELNGGIMKKLLNLLREWKTFTTEPTHQQLRTSAAAMLHYYRKFINTGSRSFEISTILAVFVFLSRQHHIRSAGDVIKRFIIIILYTGW